LYYPFHAGDFIAEISGVGALLALISINTSEHEICHHGRKILNPAVCARQVFIPVQRGRASFLFSLFRTIPQSGFSAVDKQRVSQPGRAVRLLHFFSRIVKPQVD